MAPGAAFAGPTGSTWALSLRARRVLGAPAVALVGADRARRPIGVEGPADDHIDLRLALRQLAGELKLRVVVGRVVDLERVVPLQPGVEAGDVGEQPVALAVVVEVVPALGVDVDGEVSDAAACCRGRPRRSSSGRPALFLPS